jgi:GTPase SAR1 family protein
LFYNGFSKTDLALFVDDVRKNVYQNVRSLLLASEKLEIPFKNEKLSGEIENIKKEDYSGETYNGKLLQEIWSDEGIQELFYKHRTKFQIYESAEYFFQDLERINSEDFIPTEKDILMCRIKTIGITELSFEIDKKNFRLVDVGGQRNERSKWIKCFENVDLVLFVVSLSEYDLNCYEDNTTNRLYESLALFEEISNSKFFQETPIVILFNKEDLFSKKILVTDLKVCFENYDGGKNYDNAFKFIEKAFRSRNKFDNDRIITMVSTATNTDSIKKIFIDVKNVFK